MLIVGDRFNTTTTETNSMNRLTCRLVISNCQLEDTGAYVCAATSASGTAISEASVVIKGKLILPSQPNSTPKVQLIMLAALYLGGFMSSSTRRISEGRMTAIQSHPPEFAQRLKSRVVALGDSVRLSASVIATPPANIAWEKDDIPIITDSPLSPYQTKVCLLTFLLVLSNCAEILQFDFNFLPRT